MGGRRDDSAPARGSLPPAPAPAGRRGWLVLGLGLAAAATVAVVFTDNPLYLRVALLAVCWAFVVAAFLAGNRRSDQVAAAGREAELRHAYDLELEREVAARHAYESQLESRVRREAQDALRGELGRLRSELSGLSQLREDLAGLGELRSDLGRMRTELAELLSGELLIERMVMRAQSVRGPGLPAAEAADDRTLEGAPAWQSSGSDGGWDVDRWTETRVVPATPVDAAPRPMPAPPPVPPPVSPRTPVAGLIEQSVVERPAAARSYDSAAYDDLLFGSTPPAPSYESPAHSGSTAYDASGYSGFARSADEPATSTSGAPASGHSRLEQILTGSGVEAPSGGRARRRRYRDEDGDGSGDDVLARVLGRN